MAVKTLPWDVTDHLDNKERIAGYLEAVFEDGDPDLIRAAISDVARARGMSDIAAKAGLSRAGLYKALGENGNPSFVTVLAVLKAFGVRISLAA